MTNSIKELNLFDESIMEKLIGTVGFEMAHKITLESKNATYEKYDNIGLSAKGIEFWQRTGYPTMWSHQKLAIEAALKGSNICISTSTSSGKTEIFQTIAIETLEKNKSSKVLAIYSAKALNRQQRSRWEATGYKVGQIDGDNPNIENRCAKLKECDIIVMTPDVLHAFLLANLHNKNHGETIQNFIRKIDLIIIDEVHLYKGVFGTNSAYLFRRLNNIRRILRKDHSFPQYITASATLPNPAEHSENITGVRPFVNIGTEKDGSPMAERTFYYIEKGLNDKNSLPQMIAKLAIEISKFEDARSITFVSGRQQTGDITIRGDEILEKIDKKETKIYPFRAGVEIEAREEILIAMEKKDFHGIVSTSALEIGIDVSGLNVCILANIPYDRNSYYQRIGRVGRGGKANKSIIIIVNDESLNGKLLFSTYNFDVEKLLPDLEPALHLDAQNVMFAHAACHVHSSKVNCEITDEKDVDLKMNSYFPKSFVTLCHQIISGNRPTEYDLFANKIETPHWALSLRNMHLSYLFIEDDKVLNGETVTPLQLFREAYTRAIRSTTKLDKETGKPKTYLHRVTYIDKADKKILTKKIDNKYNYIRTKPFFRTFVNPNLSKSGHLEAINCGDTSILNVRLYENKVSYGYYEIKGNNPPEYHEYEDKFKDEIATTGVIILHPILNGKDVKCSSISRMIFEAFLMQKAFDRNDISYESGTLKVPSDSYDLNAGDHFIAIYDINQLNITLNLLDKDILKKTFGFLLENIGHFSDTLFEHPINKPTREAIETICNDVLNNEIVKLREGDSEEYIYVFDSMSPALWVNNDPQNENINEIPCRVLAVEKILSEDPKNTRVKYTIWVEGTQPQKVDMEEILPVENSFFRKFNWEKGV